MTANGINGPITNIRLGMPGTGLLGRVSNTPGPPNALTQAQVKAAFGFVTAQDPVNTALTAGKWTTARTLSWTGDATGSMSVDGSANEAAALTLATVNTDVGTYTYATVTVDAKGRVTAVSNGAAPVTAIYVNLLNGDDPAIPITDANGNPIICQVG